MKDYWHADSIIERLRRPQDDRQLADNQPAHTAPHGQPEVHRQHSTRKLSFPPDFDVNVAHPGGCAGCERRQKILIMSGLLEVAVSMYPEEVNSVLLRHSSSFAEDCRLGRDILAVVNIMRGTKEGHPPYKTPTTMQVALGDLHAECKNWLDSTQAPKARDDHQQASVTWISEFAESQSQLMNKTDRIENLLDRILQHLSQMDERRRKTNSLLALDDSVFAPVSISSSSEAPDDGRGDIPFSPPPERAHAPIEYPPLQRVSSPTLSHRGLPEDVPQPLSISRKNSPTAAPSATIQSNGTTEDTEAGNSAAIDNAARSNSVEVNAAMERLLAETLGRIERLEHNTIVLFDNDQIIWEKAKGPQARRFSEGSPCPLRMRMPAHRAPTAPPRLRSDMSTPMAPATSALSDSTPPPSYTQHRRTVSPGSAGSTSAATEPSSSSITSGISRRASVETVEDESVASEEEKAKAAQAKAKAKAAGLPRAW